MRERRLAESGVLRPDYLTDSRSPVTVANDGGLVLVPLRQLLDAIGDAVRGAGGVEPSAGGRLLDRHQLAERLSVSAGTVDRLRRQGMPTLYVGESPRYVYDDCVRWLGERGAAP